MLGGALAVSLVGNSLTDKLRSNFAITVIVARDVDSPTLGDIKQLLNHMPGRAKVKYLSAAEILAAETALAGNEASGMLTENPFNDELELHLKPQYTHPDSVKAITTLIAKQKGVESVMSDGDLLRQVHSTLSNIALTLIILAALLLFISIVLINNTISLSIYSRRFLIHTMRLVGATSAFIRAPFVRSAALSGLIAGLIASGVLLGIRAYAPMFYPEIDSTLPWSEAAAIAAAITVLGAAICGLTATFSANHYLTSTYDDLFLK